MNVLKSAISPSHSRCDRCNRIYRNRSLICYKGEILCIKCRLTEPSYLINFKKYTHINETKPLSISNALQKTYTVRTYINKRGYTQCTVGVPACLSSHSLKLVLVL